MVRRTLLLALTLASACKPRPDPYAVVPLVPSASRADASSGALDPSRPRAPRPSRDASVVRFQTRDGGAPVQALGVAFGSARAELAARNRAAAVPCRDADEYTFCERALVPVPLRAVVVTYEFCGASLCSVALDGTRTRDEALMVREFDQLAAMLQGELGEPSIQLRRVGAGCSGHLSMCLASRQAEYSARWTWRDGPQVSLSVDPLEDDALVAQVAVAWLSPQRVTWDAGPPPPHPLLAAARDAGADAP
jgi:hypothetical protein